MIPIFHGTIRATSRDENKQLERGRWRYESRQPLSACETRIEQIGWKDARKDEEDAKPRSDWIIVP